MTTPVTGVATWRPTLRAPSPTERRNAASVAVLAQDIADSLAFLKQQIPSAFASLAPAKVVTTANVTLSGTQTLDGVACGVGDPVATLAQTNPVDRRVWLVQSGAWTPRTDFVAGSFIAAGAELLITSGTHARRKWILAGASPALFTNGTDSLTWSEKSLLLGQGSTLVSGKHETALTGFDTKGARKFDPSIIPSGNGITRTVTFKAVLYATAGMTPEVRLFNTTDSSVVTATVLSPGAVTVPTEVSVSLVVPTDIPNASKMYEAQVRISAGTPGVNDRAYLTYAGFDVTVEG